VPKQEIAVTSQKNGAFHPNGRWQAIAVMGNYRFQNASHNSLIEPAGGTWS